MNSFLSRRACYALFLFFALIQCAARTFADQIIYDDALENGWQNWSWATVNTASTAVVHSGSDSISVDAGAWQALALHAGAPVDTHGFASVSFWVNGGPIGGQKIMVKGLLSDVEQASYGVGPLVANTWQHIVVPLAALGIDNKTNLTAIWIQEGSGISEPTFYIDDVSLSTSGVVVLSNVGIYDDSLENGWQSWSWATVNLASTAYVHSGATSIAVDAGPWTALALHHGAVDTHGYGSVTFWINGGALGGQVLQVVATVGGAGKPPVVLEPLAANTWRKIVVPLAALGADNHTDLTDIWIQEGKGVTAPTFYVDDVSLALPAPPADFNIGIYDDALINGWQSWSWATIDTASTAVVHSGSSSIAVTAGAYTALALHHDNIDAHPFIGFEFWINGGPSGGQTLKISALLSSVSQTPITIGPLLPNTWVKYSFSLADLGVAGKPDLSGFWMQEASGNAQPTFYVDDMTLTAPPPPSVVNITVNADQVLSKISPRLFALNTAVWDGSFATSTTQSLLTEMGNKALRFPGGSASDDYHWKTNTRSAGGNPWATGFNDFAPIAKATKARVYITVNYGTGTPQEAADWVTYANKTNAYAVKYWEIGNENYGTWEADNNTRPHDPVTYATRFKDYYTQMKAVDPSIKIGAVVVTGEDSNVNYNDLSTINPRTGVVHQGWTPLLLATLKKLGVTPDFVSYHRYAQSPGGENDTILLMSSATWIDDATNLRQLLNDYLGANGPKVEIDCTENNSVYGDPGKQSTSLVNGLFLADSIGNLMKTEFKSLVWWDLRNGQDTSKNNSPALYGWRNYGDYGVVNGKVPAGPADRYPTFYVAKLLTNFARGGEKAIDVSSDYPGIGVYGIRKANGSVRLLFINKHPSAKLTLKVTVNGTIVNKLGMVYTYGIPQDEAARTGVGSPGVISSTIPLAGKVFSVTSNAYSASVLRLDRFDGHDNDNEDDGSN